MLTYYFIGPIFLLEANLPFSKPLRKLIAVISDRGYTLGKYESALNITLVLPLPGGPMI